MKKKNNRDSKLEYDVTNQVTTLNLSNTSLFYEFFSKINKFLDFSMCILILACPRHPPTNHNNIDMVHIALIYH